MIKVVVFALCLLSLSYEETLAPWHQRKFEYSVSDLCSYDDNTFQYVKPCGQNYVCNDIEGSDHHLSVCQQYFTTTKRLEDTCTSDLECDSGLKCISGSCSIEENGSPYSFNDRVLEASGSPVYTYSYCPTGLIPIQESGSSNYLCKNSNANADKCSVTNNDKTQGTQRLPDFGKICGETTVEYIQSSSSYIQYDVKMNLIGFVGVGKNVQVSEACESGFAVNLYEGAKLTRATDRPDTKFLTCVNPKAFEVDSSGNCKNVKFTLSDSTEYSIDISDMSISCKNIMTKLDLFRQYKEKRGTGCTKNKEYYDEPFTCGNDELRELWYFYHHPEEYLLYKNEQAIKEYLIQKQYPSFNAKYAEPQQEASGYLGIKFISLLILLLSL